MVGCYGPRSKNGRRTTTVPAGRSVCTGMPRPSRTGCCSDRCRRLDGQRGSAHGQPGPRLKHPEKKKLTDTLRSSFDFFLGIAAHGRRCDGGHRTRRHMVIGQRGHRSMVARGLSHRRAALRLVGWPRLRPRSQLPPAFEQLSLGQTLPR